MKPRPLFISIFLPISVLAASLVFNSASASAQEPSFRIISDATARYLKTEETGWQTLTFDDSAWPFVVAPSAGLCGTPEVPSDAPQPVWGEDPQEFETIFIRKTFMMDTPANATIVVGVDDDYDLFINGELIGGNHDGIASTDRFIDVPLQAGLNLIAIMATDIVGGCQSVMFDIFPLPAPPPNDDVTNPAVVSTLPFTDTQDTRGATIAADDPPSNCVGVPTENVWYTLTTNENILLRLTTGGSSYEAFMDVFVSADGQLNHTGVCGSGEIVFEATPGTTYYIMVSSTAFGGDLAFSVMSLGEALMVNLTLNAKGTFDPRTGSATIRGIVTCNEPTGVDISGIVRQKYRRSIIIADFFTNVPCDGASSLSQIVRSNTGAFDRGYVEILATASACGPLNCDSVDLTAIAFLRADPRIKKPKGPANNVMAVK
jgi:hypothetical protein